MSKTASAEATAATVSALAESHPTDDVSPALNVAAVKAPTEISLEALRARLAEMGELVKQREEEHAKAQAKSQPAVTKIDPHTARVFRYQERYPDLSASDIAAMMLSVDLVRERGFIGYFSTLSWEHITAIAVIPLSLSASALLLVMVFKIAIGA